MSAHDMPWGAERLILSTDIELGGLHDTLAVRKVELDAEEMTSLHRHHHKNELLVVDTGLVEIQVDDDFHELGPGEAHFIEAGTPHQLQNLDDDVAEITEINFPFDVDDVVHIEDPYADLR